MVEINDWECGINSTMTIVSSADCFDFYCQQAGRSGTRLNLIDSTREVPRTVTARTAPNVR